MLNWRPVLKPTFLLLAVSLLIGSCGSKIPKSHGVYVETDGGFVPVELYAEQLSRSRYESKLKSDEYPIFTEIKSILVNIPNIQIANCKLIALNKTQYWHNETNWTVHMNQIENRPQLQYESKTLATDVYQIFITDDDLSNYSQFYLKLSMPLGTPDRVYGFDLRAPLEIKPPKELKTSQDYIEAFIQTIQQNNYDEFLHLNIQAQNLQEKKDDNLKMWFDSMATNKIEILSINKFDENPNYIPGQEYLGGVIEDTSNATILVVYEIDYWLPSVNIYNTIYVKMIQITEEWSNNPECNYSAGEWIIWDNDLVKTSVVESDAAPVYVDLSKLPPPNIQKTIEKPESAKGKLEPPTVDKPTSSGVEQIRHTPDAGEITDLPKGNEEIEEVQQNAEKAENKLSQKTEAKLEYNKENYPAPDEFVAFDEEPQLLVAPNPVYPEMARKAGVTGTVWVKALVDKEGNVRDALVVKESGVNAGFEDAALEAAYKSKYRPAIQNNQPVPVWVAYKVEFDL